MCKIFISADPASYESRTRSVRLHDVATSVRLENLYWEVLEEIAQRDGMAVVQLIERLYDELVAERGGVGNFSSFLRVSALRYESLMAQGLVPRNLSIPIRSLDADEVLRGMTLRGSGMGTADSGRSPGADGAAAPAWPAGPRLPH